MSSLKPTHRHRKAARDVVALTNFREWVLEYVRCGRGYSDPIDLFDYDMPTPPESIAHYFAPSKDLTDEEHWALKDEDRWVEILWCPQGAVALMDEATKYWSPS